MPQYVETVYPDFIKKGIYFKPETIILQRLGGLEWTGVKNYNILTSVVYINPASASLENRRLCVDVQSPNTVRKIRNGPDKLKTLLRFIKINGALIMRVKQQRPS
ncbi:MAG: hypothetical protein K0Q50_845 [Vampirovibrio sp.]|nr:hypothetical protein [Vampirovibrio sp.]